MNCWTGCAHRPLLAEHPKVPLMMCHAGLSPQWDMHRAREAAREVEALLQSDHADWLLCHMYGNEPAHWDDRLAGLPRWRYIINCFTRMRFCYPDGRLDYRAKGSPTQPPPGLRPWFELRPRTEGETHPAIWPLGCPDGPLPGAGDLRIGHRLCLGQQTDPCCATKTGPSSR